MAMSWGELSGPSNSTWRAVVAFIFVFCSVIGISYGSLVTKYVSKYPWEVFMMQDSCWGWYMDRQSDPLHILDYCSATPES